MRKINNIFKKAPALTITVMTLIVQTVILILTYYGRIYYPYNFQPEEVSFSENYTVLSLVIWFGLFVAFFILGFIFRLIEEIKSI
jgi:hypothetical protein